jgi:recombinational DNA repair protein (RecF pathway)
MSNKSFKRSFSLKALVLKRVSVGETDRVVTLLTQEKGKLVCVAKGVRKLNSSKRAYMEPGNIIQAFFVRTKSLPLLIQAKPISDSAPAKVSLTRIRQLAQILEVYDKLFVEEQLPAHIYNLSLKVRNDVVNGELQLIKGHLGKLITLLGFPHPSKTKYKTILEYVQFLAERPMHSFEFLEI